MNYMACHFSLSLSHSLWHFVCWAGLLCINAIERFGNRHEAASISPSLDPGRIYRPSYVYAIPTANTRVCVPWNGFHERQL